MYVAIPVILMVFGTAIHRELTYLNHMEPSKYSLWKNRCDVHVHFGESYQYTATNIDIFSSQGYLIPAWYFKPSQPVSGPPIFIVYSHGNGYSRCAGYRLAAYKQLVGRGYHLITYDYGGYSNSTKTDSITDASLLKDLVDVVGFYESTLKQDQDSKLVLWGHSLGTAVSSATLAEYEHVSKITDALVLEAPFSSYKEMVMDDSPLAAAFYAVYRSTWIMIIDHLSRRSQVGEKFETTENLKLIGKANIPVIMAHAEDDFIIPYANGRKLYDSTSDVLKSASFIRIGSEHGIGHNRILADKPGSIFERLDTVLVDEE